MENTKAETLQNLKNQVSKFTVPKFFYFTVQDYKDSKKSIIKKVKNKFNSYIVVRSSSIYEDGSESSSAGEFESFLDIDSQDSNAVMQSIDRVIDSYSHKESDKNQILVQEMLRNTSMSGVVFTHDLNTGAPYYVINYDDESGSTDTVTSGKGEYSNRTLYIHRSSLDKIQSSRFKALIFAIQELERIVKSEHLDIEFALSKDLEPYLLQVRPITTKSSWNKNINNKINNVLNGVDAFLTRNSMKIDGVYGETSVYGQMPDWNPVEMIGRAPRALAASLYRLIITDNSWRIARQQMGYAVPAGQPLMKMIAGQPYIDTRLSFHSYLPKNIEDTVGEALVDHWVSSLSNQPELHDKIEFDIAITTYSFDFDKKVDLLIGDALNSKQKENLKKLYLQLTKDLIQGNNAGSIENAMTKIKALDQKQKIKSENLNINNLFDMVENCVHLGTVPFSILARHGFIAKTILLSLVERGVLSNDEVNQIQSSVHTIASELVDDMACLDNDKISIQDFMKKYGHLRPGTYEITSQRYDQIEGFSSGKISSESKIISNNFIFSEVQKKKIKELLIENDFHNFNPEDLLEYIYKAIEGREYGKFIFTKTLSNILELIANYGSDINLTREELSHIPIEEILKLQKTSIDCELTQYLKNVSMIEQDRHKISSAIRLPQVLIDNSGIFVIPFQVSQPNFITNKKIISDILVLANNNEENNLLNKIVLIEGADPGYDWIFSQNISGLITKYGGANSHMAIRCAEFGIPAAIGCGEQRYESIKKSKRIQLDCSAGLLHVIH